MITIGAFEAKTHLSALLEKVILGEEILITKRGKPVARLIPEPGHIQQQTDDAIQRLKQLRTGTASGNGLDWKTLRDTGRK